MHVVRVTDQLFMHAGFVISSGEEKRAQVQHAPPEHSCWGRDEDRGAPAWCARNGWKKRIAQRARCMVAAVLQRVRGADGNPVQRFHILALVRRGLVVDLVVPQRLAQHVVHRRFLGEIHRSNSPAPLPNPRSRLAPLPRTVAPIVIVPMDSTRTSAFCFWCEERIDFVQPEQPAHSDQSTIGEDAAVIRASGK